MSFIPTPHHAVPVLDTARLCLRGYQPGDFAAWAAMWQDPDFYRYTTGVPLPAEDAWFRLLRTIGHWTLLGYGFWAVEEKASGHFIGSVGFADFQRDIQPPIGAAPEMGWVLASGTHGQGYASEAVAAALAWGEAHFGPGRIVCLIHPENAASLRVAAKFGFRQYAQTTYHDAPGVLLERTGQGPAAG
ncbi:GNAT family N-acetyltransferase [uncultured Hymenobacter sp.]|uniref:GNAT family N-acetyltransferase n=1 Tax=uncultured Hymenobacter sp. TaxID=170016 RepID=UPI0035CC4A42